MQKRKIVFALALFLALLQSQVCLGQSQVWFARDYDAGSVKEWAKQSADRYWIEGEGGILLVLGKTEALPASLERLELVAQNQSLNFFKGAHALPEGSRELLRGGRTRVIASKQALPPQKSQHAVIEAVKRNHSLQRALAFRPADEILKRADSREDSIHAEQWRLDVEELSRLSRYTYGKDIELAKAWLMAQFQSIPGIEVREQFFGMPRGSEASNVIATLPGRSRAQEIFIVGAHYDSISERSSALAPGAEDNASGVAGLLALARYFAQQPPEATIVFVAFSGEEQGLYGSEHYTTELLKDEKAAAIKGVFIMDMIGYSEDEEQDCLLETSSATRPLLASIQAANTDPELKLAESFDYWGSDHVPFLDRDIPAVLFIANDYLDYPDYHRSTDTADKLHPTLAPKTLRLMATSLQQLVY